MRPDGGAYQVVRVLDVGDPVAHRFVDGVLQRGLPRSDRNDLCAQDVHAKDVERLPRAVDGAHVHDALQAEQGAHRGRRDAVLPRTGLGDDSRLAQPLRQQRLADRVVDLVRSRVRQFFPFEPNACAPDVVRQPLREIQRRRSSDEALSVERNFFGELRIASRHGVFSLQLRVRRRQRFRNVPSAERPEVVRQRRHVRGGGFFCHERRRRRGVL
mmetsp:Transcript_4270/g.13304  ORF Transcript_4270/g.13304 Transcript_4270/m.13304 type:complete len:214 (+) Transcript_4270:819-1460(+)